MECNLKRNKIIDKSKLLLFFISLNENIRNIFAAAVKGDKFWNRYILDFNNLHFMYL